MHARLFLFAAQDSASLLRRSPSSSSSAAAAAAATVAAASPTDRRRAALMRLLCSPVCRALDDVTDAEGVADRVAEGRLGPGVTIAGVQSTHAGTVIEFKEGDVTLDGAAPDEAAGLGPPGEGGRGGSGAGAAAVDPWRPVAWFRFRPKPETSALRSASGGALDDFDFNQLSVRLAAGHAGAYVCVKLIAV